MDLLIDYSPIPVKQLISDAPTNFDSYMYFQVNKKMIKIKQSGDTFEKTKIDDLIGKKVNFLYVKKEEKDKFFSYKAKVFTKIFNDSSLTSYEKAKLVRDKSRDTINELNFATNKEEANILLQNCCGMTKAIITEVSSENFSLAFDKILNLVKTGSTLMAHSANVSSLSVMFAMLMSINNPKDIEEIAMGALVHDLGLTFMNESILIKYLEGLELSEEELRQIKEHPKLTKEMLERQKTTLTPNAFDIVIQHHECHDGSGYPRRLKSMQINYFSKIVALADSFDIEYRKLVNEEKFDELRSILINLKKNQDGLQKAKKFDIKILDLLIMNMFSQSVKSDTVS